LHVMFAGGIVITPFLSMIEYFQRINAVPQSRHISTTAGTCKERSHSFSITRRGP
jgi:ferredoxin-NADP reductase